MNSRLLNAERRTAIHPTHAVRDYCRQLTERLQNLIAGIRSKAERVDPDAAIGEIRLLIQAMPLTSEEYSVAVNRLRNAGDYLVTGEQGAAVFELRLLARSAVSLSCI